jgi:hypothetical protein
MDRHPAPQVVVREASAGDVLDLLAPVDRVSTTNEPMDYLASVGRCFVISQDERDVAAYVLQRRGDECYVLAAAGSVDFDLTAFGLALIEAHARGLSSVAFQTKRPGLIRRASRLGYRIAGRAGSGVVMRKELT